MSERILYEFGTEPEWDEWGAALYESVQADKEAYEGLTSDAYADTAMTFCERLEYEVYEALDAETHYNM